MIKVAELRIFDWAINDCDDNYIQLKAQDVLTASKDEDWLLPIPIAPEILEQCGFEKLQLESWELSEGEEVKNDFKLSYGGGEIYISRGMHGWDDAVYVWGGLGDPQSYGVKCNIEYLHQLQNLYFALTGHELEIKQLPLISTLHIKRNNFPK